MKIVKVEDIVKKYDSLLGSSLLILCTIKMKQSAGKYGLREKRENEREVCKQALVHIGKLIINKRELISSSSSECNERINRKLARLIAGSDATSLSGDRLAMSLSRTCRKCRINLIKSAEG